MALSTATVVSSGHEELAVIPVQRHQALRMEPEGELGEGGEGDSIRGDLSGWYVVNAPSYQKPQVFVMSPCTIAPLLSQSKR